ncbi:universal stress protein [Paucidesulfovibrio longus]|uniref:universal stress protein n=1 Tax=Paucidesulfovibrio longus TaxID=889 RepID=UPI0003B6B0E1|nr:universal stress protein [Paucidesulfovibrio longus]
MKILVAVDENLYSMYALGEAARLAMNTWPDVSLLAVERESSPLFDDDAAPADERHPGIGTLRNYREEFLSIMGEEAQLYAAAPASPDFREAGKNVLEEKTDGGRKDFRLRLRSGNTVKAILAEAREEQSDLIVLGSARSGSGWGGGDVPGKVAEGADCSVLVVKEARRPAKVTCILDHANVSQQSLEMINQLVTLYGVDLEIAGVLKRGELREEVERKMGEVLDYYIQRGVRALVKVVDAASLGSFLSLGSRTDLMALWLGPKSGLQRFFKRDHVAELVNGALSSVLILR